MTGRRGLALVMPTAPVWREDRVLAQIRVDPDGPAFVDIDTSRTLNHLSDQPELRAGLDSRGVSDLDRRVLYTENRRVTRLLGHLLRSHDPHPLAYRPVSRCDPDLRHVAMDWALTLH